VQLAAGVATWANDSSWGWFSASADGRVAWLSQRDDTVRLDWIDRAGMSLGSVGEPGRYAQIALSPDGRKVAAEVRDAEGRYDIWLIDAARGVASRLTNDPADERDPVWSPDGREVVFATNRGGDQDLLRKSLQETEPATPLPRGAGATPAVDDVAESWSGASSTLLFLTLGEPRTVWSLSPDAGAPPQRLVQGRFGVDEPHVSPDGRWLAYVSTDSGRHEVYVEPFGRRGETVRVSSDGGGQPRWRRDGNELFYLSLDGRLVAASIREGAAGPDVAAPTTLVPADRLNALVEGPDYDDYDVAADGRRFLVKRRVSPSQPQRIHVLVDGLAGEPGR
jgi:Tol biopolymer transport system component